MKKAISIHLDPQRDRGGGGPSHDGPADHLNLWHFVSLTVELIRAGSRYLRLVPVSRMVKHQYRLFNYELEPGSVCLMSPYVMHRNPRFYPGPERFDPERFTPEKRSRSVRIRLLPLGGGPGVCIGERFAWMEGALVLATILPRWRFHLLPGQIVEPHPQITCLRYGVKMKLERQAADNYQSTA